MKHWSAFYCFFYFCITFHWNLTVTYVCHLCWYFLSTHFAVGSIYVSFYPCQTWQKLIKLCVFSCLLFVLISGAVFESTYGQIVRCLFGFGPVVNQQYDPEVQNPAAFVGSNVLLKCNIPTFVKDYVSVISWLQEPSFNIYPATESGKYSKIKKRFPRICEETLKLLFLIE